MTRLTIDADWTDYLGLDLPEIRSTYANLKISVGDEIITTLHRRKSRTTGDAVFVSLYPLAEWIVGNWWCLLEEAEVPGRNGFVVRHGINQGRAGYCLPDLRFKPEGESYLLEWAQYSYVHAPVDFTKSGSARLSKEHVEECLRDFVDRVDERLLSVGIRDTWLQQEWAEIHKTELNKEELDFCRAAAWLGLDPFDVSEEQAKILADTIGSIPGKVVEDSLRATQIESLPGFVKWLTSQLQTGVPGRSVDERLQRIALQATSSAVGPPWRTGYDLAREVRAAIPDLAQSPTPLEVLFDGKLPIEAISDSPDSVDGLVVVNGELSCRSTKRRPESIRFLSARAAFAYMCMNQTSLLTTARTTRQSEGRAFAAELLAPADALRAKIGSTWISGEQLSDLAAEFDVSEYVVAYQMQNHHIADLPNGLL